MPVVSVDDLSFSGLAWTFRWLTSKRPACGTKGHWPIHFRDQHMDGTR